MSKSQPREGVKVTVPDWQVVSLRVYGNTVGTKSQYTHREGVINYLQSLGISVTVYKKLSGTIVIATHERREEMGDL